MISASGTGTLIAKDEVDLAFETGGKVTSINVKVGDQVKAGDVLATVDDTDLKIQYAQARRALQDLTSPSAIAEANAGIATAKSDLTSAIQHLAYIISPNVLHWENEIEKAQATLEAAQAAARLLSGRQGCAECSGDRKGRARTRPGWPQGGKVQLHGDLSQRITSPSPRWIRAAIK